MAAMEASRASSGDSSLARKASTRLQASPNHGCVHVRRVPATTRRITIVVGSVRA